MKENYMESIGDKFSIIQNKCKGGYSQLFFVKDNEAQKEYAAKILTNIKHMKVMVK